MMADDGTEREPLLVEKINGAEAKEAEERHHRVRQYTVFMYCLQAAVNGAMLSAFGPSVEALERRLKVGEDVLGSTVTINRIGKLIATLVFGVVANCWQSTASPNPTGLARLIDSNWHLVGPHAIMAVCLLLSGLCAAHIASGRTILGVECAQFVSGIGYGFSDAAYNMLAMWVWHPDSGAMRACLSLVATCFTMGAVASPMLVAGSLAYANNVRYAFMALSAVSVPLSAVYLAVPSPRPIPPVQPGDGDDEEEPHEEPHKLGGSSSAGPDAVYASVCVFLTAFAMLLGVGAEHTMGTWISTYAVEQLRFTEAEGAMLASGYWTAMTTGRMMYAFSSNLKATNTFILLLNNALCAISACALFSSCRAVVVAGVCLLGLGVSTVFPCSLLVPAEHQLRTTPTVMTTILLFGAMGEMAAPYALGLVFERNEYWVLPVSLLVAFVVATALTFVVDRMHRSGSARPGVLAICCLALAAVGALLCPPPGGHAAAGDNGTAAALPGRLAGGELELTADPDLLMLPPPAAAQQYDAPLTDAPAPEPPARADDFDGRAALAAPEETPLPVEGGDGAGGARDTADLHQLVTLAVAPTLVEPAADALQPAAPAEAIDVGAAVGPPDVVPVALPPVDLPFVDSGVDGLPHAEPELAAQSTDGNPDPVDVHMLVAQAANASRQDLPPEPAAAAPPPNSTEPAGGAASDVGQVDIGEVGGSAPGLENQGNNATGPDGGSDGVLPYRMDLVQLANQTSVDASVLEQLDPAVAAASSLHLLAQAADQAAGNGGNGSDASGTASNATDQ